MGLEARFAQMMGEIGESDAVLSFQMSPDKRSAFFEVATGQGRSQVVMSQLAQEPSEEGSTWMLHMLSEVCVAEPSMYEWALVRNLSLRYGRIALVESDGFKNLALVFAQPFEALDAVTFAWAFGELAYMPDGMREALRST